MNICCQSICILLGFSFQIQYCVGTVWKDISQFFEKLGNDVKCLTGSCQKNEEVKFKPPVLRQLPDPDDVATAMPPPMACIPVTIPPPPSRCTTKTKADYIAGHGGSTRLSHPGFGTTTPTPKITDDCENDNVCETDNKSSAGMGAANTVFETTTLETDRDDCATDDDSNAAMGAAPTLETYIDDCATDDNSSSAMGAADAAFNISTLEPGKDDCATDDNTGMGAAYKDDCATDDNSKAGMGAANAANNSPTLETDDCATVYNSNAGMGAGNAASETVTFICTTYNQSEAVMGAANTDFIAPSLDTNVDDCVTDNNSSSAMGAANVDSNAPALVMFICNCTLCKTNGGAMGTGNVNDCVTDTNTATMGASNANSNSPNLEKKKTSKCLNGNKVGAANEAVKANCKAICKRTIDTSPEIVDSHEGLNTLQANGVVAKRLFNGRLPLR